MRLVVSWAVFALALALLVPRAVAGDLVHVVDATQASRCAENDNVYVKFIAAGIAHFTIEARHPSYLATVAQDSTAPDFTACDQSHDPTYAFEPLTVTLFEDSRYKLVGHRFSNFWRPETVDFKIGHRVVTGLHLVQLIRKLDGRQVEILVVYPSDGYWRLKPLPPAGVEDTAYGASFLVGSIREDGRPYVPLSAIEFIRSPLSFRLTFKPAAAFPSNTGTLRLQEASRRRARLRITLPRARHSALFAALRSMFVSPDMADTAEAVLNFGAGPAPPAPILAFPPADIAAALFERATPSRHNTSAPDLAFEDFTRR
jgi:hypothetical protein